MNMKRVRDFFGYLLGGVLFVALIPTIMWLASGMPALWPIDTGRCIVAPVVMFVGLVLSIWTIVYMRNRGKGNPMDAFGHEVAPRTQHLMIEGPYKINRNPMLTGTLVYLVGAAVWLWTWQSCVVFVAFFAIMMVQVLSEEKRLRRDFGEEYEEYCKRSRRF
jgi:protein-S-isoprenylcysteine O-methyltransferase Ste14